MKRQILMCGLATVGLLVFSAGAQAAAISWNVDNNSTVGGDGAGSLPSLSEEAGVVRVGGWSQTFPDDPTTDLRDDSGVSTSLDIAYSSTNGTWAINFSHPGQDADGSWNKEMINGYLNAGNGGTSSVEITEIPYNAYSIIAYFSSDSDAREGSVTDGSTVYYFNTIGGASTSDADALLIQATDTVDDPTDPDANYAVFSGLSGASQTITVDIPEFGGLAGFQVVEIPEPASIMLGGLSCVLILSIQRRS